MPNIHILTLLAARLAIFTSIAHALTITYCSPDNTGADDGYAAAYSEFQSNGLCQQTCQDSYAYAILQGSDCWCSNYAPSDQESTDNCNSPCPGYGADWCGSPSSGLYGYYALTISPSGTAGGSTSASSATQGSSSVSATSSIHRSHSFTQFLGTKTPSSSSSSSTLTSVVPGQSSVQTSPSTIESSSSVYVPVSSVTTSSTTAQAQSSTMVKLTSTSPTSVYTPPSSSTPDPSSSSPSPTSAAQVATQAFTSVTTVTGQARTIIITPSTTADPTLGQSSVSSGGISKGTVAGVVVGVAIGCALIIGLIVWFFLKRKHANATRGSAPPYGPTFDRDQTLDPSRQIPSRQVSQMSSAGLIAGKAPRIQTHGFVASNGPRSPETPSAFSPDRRSVGTDQRLNPYALFAHEEARQSNISLQDNQDYSRQLRVANPDP